MICFFFYEVEFLLPTFKLVGIKTMGCRYWYCYGSPCVNTHFVSPVIVFFILTLCHILSNPGVNNMLSVLSCQRCLMKTHTFGRQILVKLIVFSCCLPYLSRYWILFGTARHPWRKISRKSEL